METTGQKKPNSQLHIASERIVFPFVIFGQAILRSLDSQPPSIYEIADAVARLLGMQAIPTRGKIPALGHEFTKHQRTTPGAQEAASGVWEHADGFGLMALPNTNFYLLDCDDPDFLNWLFVKFPKLAQTPIIYRGNWKVSGHAKFVIRLTVSQPFTKTLSLKALDGRGEIASLRGHHSYGLGPGSRHPETGEIFEDNGIAEPVTLDADETRVLLERLSPDRAEVQPPGVIPLWKNRERLKTELETHFRAQGYHQNGEWLNGPCVHPERHKHGDTHPSFGFNTTSGRGLCFVCGVMSTFEVGAALNNDNAAAPIPLEVDFEALQNEVIKRPYAFVGELPTSPDADRVMVELNISTALIARHQYQAARLHDLLLDHARTHNGQHTFTTTDLNALGEAHGLSRLEVQRARRQLLELGLLIKLKHGKYRRVGVAQAQHQLNLEITFSAAPIPRTALMGTAAEYRRAVLLAVEHFLPSGLASETIAKAAGISRRCLYYDEKVLNVRRVPHKKQPFDLSQAFASEGQDSEGPDFGGMQDEACNVVNWLQKQELDDFLRGYRGERVRLWTQEPSTRFLPSLTG